MAVRARHLLLICVLLVGCGGETDHEVEPVGEVDRRVCQRGLDEGAILSGTSIDEWDRIVADAQGASPELRDLAAGVRDELVDAESQGERYAQGDSYPDLGRWCTDRAAEEAAETTEAPATEPAEPERDQDEGQDLYGVGETATSGDFDIIVNTVEDPFVPPDDSETPPRGQRYVAIEATVTNNSDQAETFSRFATWMNDSESRQWTFAVGRNFFGLPQLDGEIDPGASLRGWISFAVAEDATGLVVVLPGNLDRHQARFALD